MKYETLGSSSLQISRIVHGCMELGGGPWDVRTDAENAALAPGRARARRHRV